MILRKPYAFFIKFFKFFHLIIFALAAVLLYRTSLIYNFMKEFCASNPNVIGKDLVSPFFAYWLYILIIIILVVNILLIFILIRKDKPFMFYIFNIALYVAVLVVFIVSHNIISNMQTMLIATKTTLAIRDFLNLARLFQTVSVIFYLVRATGFDIKKFDFVRDLQSLDISEEDSEEIEVAVEFEGNVVLRNLKKHFREFKYYYKENKFIINMFSLLFLGIVLLIVYFSFNKYDKIYAENDFFSVNGFNIGVKSSGILTSDYMGKNIVDDDNVLVVVTASIRGYNGTIPSSRAVLVVNGMQYYHTKIYASSLADLGNIYNEQTIGDDFTDYLFVYKIPKEDVSDNMIFRYIDNIEYKRGKTYINSMDVKLSPIDYSNVDSKTFEYALSNEININNYKLILSSYEINDEFVINYNSCVRSNECYDFREVLRPSVAREREKVLLKIDGNILYNDELGKSTNLYNFISQFGSIEYVYQGNTYIESSDFNLVVSSKANQSNIYYVEVDREIMGATSIKLVFNFRDTKYAYVLRGDISE